MAKKPRAVDDERNWKRVPIAELASPQKGGAHMVHLNAWWAVDAEDRAFFFRSASPQCNANKAVVESLHTHPDMVRVVQLPVAMWPISISDYV